ncbi:hypothetical protein AGMMS49975_16280 [Clostridia bacterium]|nr:hypothetical protein AGMMS49975_16280 [Clostridia bacterium]
MRSQIGKYKVKDAEISAGWELAGGIESDSKKLDYVVSEVIKNGIKIDGKIYQYPVVKVYMYYT